MREADFSMELAPAPQLRLREVICLSRYRRLKSRKRIVAWTPQEHRDRRSAGRSRLAQA